MPTFRIRAMVDGRMRRSWGESVDEAAARRDATKQLKKISRNFQIISVEEVEPEVAAAEDIYANIIGADRVNTPNEPDTNT